MSFVVFLKRFQKLDWILNWSRKTFFKNLVTLIQLVMRRNICISTNLLSKMRRFFFKQKLELNGWHQVIKIHPRTTIKCLVNSHGQRVTNPKIMHKMAVEFYEQLLGAFNNSLSEDDVALVSQLFSNQISEQQKAAMQKMSQVQRFREPFST